MTGTVIEAERLLRRLLGSQKRTKNTTTCRVDRTADEIRYCTFHRRYRLSSLNVVAKAGFPFLTNDGPWLTIALARALDPDRPAWPPGERRPLP